MRSGAVLGAMRRIHIGAMLRCGVGTAIVLASLGAAGCSTKLEDAACLALRGEAFEIINSAHTCNDDSDCIPSDWPGCAKPASNKDKARVTELKIKFDTGACQEPAAKCRETPEVYCKQGLCVFREQAGQTNPN